MAKRGKLSKRDVYAAQAVEMYNYIQQQLPEDAVICFAKPRMLYLNTGRVAFRAGTNDRGPLDADYYLQYRYSRFNTTPPAKSAFKSMELVQTTKAFALYRVKK